MRLRRFLGRVRNLPARSRSGVSTRWMRPCCGWVVSTLRIRPPRWKITTCPTLTGCWTLSTAPLPSSQEYFVTDSLQHFRLPDVGEGLTEADIVQWLVQPGDEVQVNQAIVEIETAKSLVELPSPYDGVVVELLFAEGDTVEVGVPIITIGPAGSERIKDGVSSPGAHAAADGAGAGASAQEASSAEEDTGAGGPPEEDQASDMLVGYGPKAGGSSRRRRRVMASADGATPAAKAAEPAARPAVEPAVRDVPSPEAPVAPAEVAPSQSARVIAKPPVRKLARDLGIDLSAVWCTGPGGIITREDVVQASEKTEPRSMALWTGDDQPVSYSGEVAPYEI